MLQTGLSKDSESVFIDILSYSDLEVFKARKNVSSRNSLISQANSARKRYMIVTYASEFDRVHYPLTLSFEQGNNVQSMQRTITRLRKLLELSNNSNSKTSTQSIVAQQLRKENSELRNRLRIAEGRIAKLQIIPEKIRLRENEGKDEIIRRLKNRIVELEKSLFFERQHKGFTKEKTNISSIPRRSLSAFPDSRVNRDNSIKYHQKTKTVIRARSVSPGLSSLSTKSSSSSKARFDPTAYHELRQKKLLEIEQTKKRNIDRYRLNSSIKSSSMERSRTPSPLPSRIVKTPSSASRRTQEVIDFLCSCFLFIYFP